MPTSGVYGASFAPHSAMSATRRSGNAMGKPVCAESQRTLGARSRVLARKRFDAEIKGMKLDSQQVPARRDALLCVLRRDHARGDRTAWDGCDAAKTAVERPLAGR